MKMHTEVTLFYKALYTLVYTQWTQRQAPLQITHSWFFFNSESYETELNAIPDQSKFQSSLTNRRIYTMASTPPDAREIRYFFYAQVKHLFISRVKNSLANAITCGPIIH